MSVGARARCPACGQEALGPGGVCDHCGSAFGEENRCPHCRAVARAEPHPELRLVCAVCGGPRVRSYALEESTQRDVDRALARAKALGGPTAWSWVAALPLALVLSVAIAWTLGAAAGAVSAIVLVASVLAFGAGRARKLRAARGAAVDEAWEKVAAALVERDGAMTARGLAQRLDVDEARADRLLTSLAVHDRVRVDVADDAEVRYRIEPDVLDSAEDDLGAFDEASTDATHAPKR